MARKKTQAQEVQEMVVAVEQAQEVQEMVKEDKAMTRANRVTINVAEVGFKADFYRTHKKITTIFSVETGWEMDAEMNKSAQREDFRQYVIRHAEVFGVEWKPQDMRSDANKRYAKYETDEMVMEDTINMLRADIESLISKSPYDISLQGIEVDAINPVYKSAKGTDLGRLGIIDGKYEKSGNWAWAEVAIIVTMEAGDEEIYFSTNCQLVSGQLKKPHITQTAFNADIKASLVMVGILKEEEEAESK